MGQNGINIRNARSSDMETVFLLIKELAVYENAAEQVTNTVENLKADGFGSDKVFDCVVAEFEGVVIGFALYYTSYSTWTGKCLYLEDFLVTQPWRRKGVGKRLFDRVHAIAKEKEVARFEWQVLDWNKSAISFYKKYNANLDEEWINCRLMLASK